MCFAKDFEVLYFVKKAKPADVKNIADFYSRQKNMFYVSSRQNYTYVLPSQNSEDYYVMLFSQNGKDTDFYLYSSSDKSAITKELLKRFKNNNLKYSKNSSKYNIETKRKQAIAVKKDYTLDSVTLPKEKTNSVVLADSYDFSDEAQQKYNSSLGTSPSINSDSITPQIQVIPSQTRYNYVEKPKKNDSQNVNLPQNPNVQQGQVSKDIVLTTPQTTSVSLKVPVVLQSAINSSSLDQNDRISAVLQEDLYINNQLKAEKGSIVYGTATEAKKASRAYKNGSISLVFDKIMTLDGTELAVTSKKIEYSNANSNRGAKIAGAMVGSMLVGLAGAAISTALSSDPNWALGLSAGAITGALGGGFVVYSATGEEVELNEGAVIEIEIMSVQ